ncbi:UNVERIFIED_CONTAM: hypothetical protein GTU68_066020 [Idotea baltica]|nr:hypothetical protein [Idotea baltica]
MNLHLSMMTGSTIELLLWLEKFI